MAKSEFVGVVVTSHFNQGKWISGEVHQALSREKDEDRTLVLPLLAQAVPLPPVLSTKKYLDFAGDYFASLVRLVGLIHDLPTDSIEDAISSKTPRDLAGSVRLLKYVGFDPLIVVGTQTLEEIEHAGGVKRGEIVRFNSRQILRNTKISGSLRELMEMISKLD